MIKKILSEVKSLFKNRSKTKKADFNEFYDGFRNGIHEVKSSLEGKAELKDVKAWLDELQD